MADDIVTQLQQLSASLGRGEGRSTVLGAAAEIERLRALVASFQRQMMDLAVTNAYLDKDD